MKRISIPYLRNICLLAVCLFFFLGLSIRQEWLFALVPLVIAVSGWIITRVDSASPGYRLKTSLPLGTIVFLGAIIGASVGSFNGLPVWSMLLVVVFAVFYWDLDALIQRMKRIEHSDELQMVELEHLRRLAVAGGIGITASLPGLFLQVKINLFWAIILGLVIIFGIRQAVNELTQQKEVPD